jgi:hypothetical protein
MLPQVAQKGIPDLGVIRTNDDNLARFPRSSVCVWDGDYVAA